MNLDTSRMLIRQLDLADASDLFSFFSDEEVVKYAVGYPHSSISESIDYIESLFDSYDQGGASIWGVVDKLSSSMIGTIGFELFFPQHHRAEVGFTFAKPYWGKGMATEALHAIVHYGFTELDLNRIEATSQPSNFASQRVLEKVGFSNEGLLSEYICSREQYFDVFVYGLTRSVYLA